MGLLVWWASHGLLVLPLDKHGCSTCMLMLLEGCVAFSLVYMQACQQLLGAWRMWVCCTRHGCLACMPCVQVLLLHGLALSVGASQSQCASAAA